MGGATDEDTPTDPDLTAGKKDVFLVDVSDICCTTYTCTCIRTCTYVCTLYIHLKFQLDSRQTLIY